MLSTASSSRSIAPGAAAMTPVPNKIDACEPGGVNGRTR
jgi:hypothetical protein